MTGFRLLTSACAFSLIVLCVHCVEGQIGTDSPTADVTENDQSERLDAHEVEQAVSEVLSSPEYRHLRKVEREEKDADLPEWLKNFLKWLFGEERQSREPVKPLFDVGQIFYYIAIVVLAVALVVMIASLFQRLQRSSTKVEFPDLEAEEALAPSRPAGEIPANEYELRALAACQAGDFRGALRELVLGGMSWAERGGFIRYRKGLTNREYVRAIWNSAQQREALLKIVKEFELVFYGHRTPQEAAVEACLAEFRSAFLQGANHAVLET